MKLNKLMYPFDRRSIIAVLMKKKKLVLISLLQALGQALYIDLVGLIFWRGNEWFGKMNFYLGPVLFLTLFVVSALISAFIVFGYPITLFFVKKKQKDAIKLVIYTGGWLLLLLIVLFVIIILR